MESFLSHQCAKVFLLDCADPVDLTRGQLGAEHTAQRSIVALTKQGVERFPTQDVAFARQNLAPGSEMAGHRIDQGVV